MRVVPRLRRGPVLPALVLGLAAVSCAPTSSPPSAEPKAVPRGRIVRDGVPVKPAGRSREPGDSGMRVLFIRVGQTEPGRPIAANVLDAEPGTFELVGQDTRPIPPGRYRVAVILGPEGRRDALEGKFGPDNSPIEVEVKEGQDLIIDLANYP